MRFDGEKNGLQRRARLLGHVDLALVQALDQFARRQVDQHDVAQAIEERVGHRLADAHAGDLRDDVVEALEVLDVDRRVDVDAGVEQLLDVLLAALVAAAGDVAVGEFVDQRHPRPAREQGVEVELLERRGPCSRAPARQDLEPFEQRLGLGAAVGLDDADHHVDALARAARAPR